MSHAPPPVPPEQRSPGPNVQGETAPGTEAETVGAGGLEDRRDRATNAQSADKGDADVNTDQQGRFGDIAQNTTHQRHQQDR